MFRLALKSTNKKNKNIFNLKNTLFIGALASLTNISIALKTLFLFFKKQKQKQLKNAHKKLTQNKPAVLNREHI